MSIRRSLLASSFLVPFFGLALLAQTQQEATAPAPYLNPALSIDQRVNDLLSRMTL